MGPSEYGGWQIYCFYLTYLNFIGIGFNDGIIINYAGTKYSELPFRKLKSGLRILIYYITVLSLILLGISKYIYIENIFITRLLILNILPFVIFCIGTSIFLTINKSVLYNLFNLGLRVLSCILYIILIVCNVNTYQNMIIVDTISRIFFTIFICVMIKKLIIGDKIDFKEGIEEIKYNCSPGIKVMGAIIISGLLPLFGRIVIQHNESIEVYGIYSFAISLLSIILTFTSAVGTVVFPMIKHIKTEFLQVYYNILLNMYDLILCTAFLVFIPLKLLIINFMPEYESVLAYLPILIIMCLPLGKIQMIIFPYYKTYRMEKSFLIFSSIGLVCMILGTYMGYALYGIVGVALASVLIMDGYSYILEKYLIKRMEEAKLRIGISSKIMMLIFVVSGLTQNLIILCVVYGISLIIYGLIKTKKIWNEFRSLKSE